jgi:phospholipase C
MPKNRAIVHDRGATMSQRRRGQGNDSSHLLSRRDALQGVGAAIGASVLPGCSSTDNPPGSTPGPDEPTPEELLAEIDTFVVVMMENRSFDHYFGSLSLLEGKDVDGLTGSESNPSTSGGPVAIHPMSVRVTNEDPPHGWDGSHGQWNSGANDGFVLEHEKDHGVGSAEADHVMGYYKRDDLPILYALADESVLCEKWFCSVMGPTWPNRFYLHCATSEGMMTNDLPPTAQQGGKLLSIWDRLDAAGISNGYFYGNLPFNLTYGRPNADFAFVIDDFYTRAAAGSLPQVTFVEPTLTALTTIGNDDHPPADVGDGQTFLASVYKALAESPQWSKTLLVITYDEHGGYFDHVSPGTTTDERPEFRQLGFRVPSLVVGPRVRKGAIDNTQFDHVSVAATITKRFGLEPLNARVSATKDLSSCLDPKLIDAPRNPVSLPSLQAMSSTIRTAATPRGQIELANLVASMGGARSNLRVETQRSLDSIRRHAQRLGVFGSASGARLPRVPASR